MQTEKLVEDVKRDFVFGVAYLLMASTLVGMAFAVQRPDYLGVLYFLLAVIIAIVSGFCFARAALALKALPSNYREVIAQEKAAAANQALEKMTGSDK